VPLSPIFSEALTSAIDELMTGKHGRPYTLVEAISWLFNELVVPKHPIGKAFELSVKEAEDTQGDLLELLKEPKKLREELEGFLSPGIVNYSTSIEHALLGRLAWSRIPVEFMMVWIFGRARWVVESAKPLELEDFKRVSFLARNPAGKKLVFISASGETDGEAEKQGLAAYELVKGDVGGLPVYVVTLSRENEGQLKKGNPGILRLHYLSSFLATRA
jgi:hypothetical protein